MERRGPLLLLLLQSINPKIGERRKEEGGGEADSIKNRCEDLGGKRAFGGKKEGDREASDRGREREIRSDSTSQHKL